MSKTLASSFLGTTGISEQMLELNGTSRLADSIAGMVSGIDASSFLGIPRLSDQTAELFRRWEGGDVSTGGRELLGREFSLASGACPLDDDPSVLQALNMLMRLQRPDLRNDPQARATTTAVASAWCFCVPDCGSTSWPHRSWTC